MAAKLPWSWSGYAQRYLSTGCAMASGDQAVIVAPDARP